MDTLNYSLVTTEMCQKLCINIHLNRYKRTCSHNTTHVKHSPSLTVQSLHEYSLRTLPHTGPGSQTLWAYQRFLCDERCVCQSLISQKLEDVSGSMSCLLGFLPACICVPKCLIVWLSASGWRDGWVEWLHKDDYILLSLIPSTRSLSIFPSCHSIIKAEKCGSN